MAEVAQSRSHTGQAAQEKSKARRSFRSDAQHSSGHHRHRRHARETVQSAIELRSPITFENLLRRDKKDSDSSRRDSSTAQQQLDGTAESPKALTEQKSATAEDVEKAKRDNVAREEDLRKSLKGLEEVGMSSTRQLDDTYYAILEKASILRSTVASLQQLAEESRSMHTAFQESTAQIEDETKQNIEGVGNFEQQEQTIDQLVSRLEESRGRTEELNARLETARLRVEAYEERENAKAARRRTQLNMIWMSLVAVLVLVSAVVLARHRRAVGKRLYIFNQRLAGLGDWADDVVTPIASKLKPSPSEDPYLRRLFDEL